jgi:hypothetical protein
MSRRKDNLERLCNKLEHRFGRTDPLFVKAKTELETHESYGQISPLRHDWSKSYGAFIKGWATDSVPKSRH